MRVCRKCGKEKAEIEFSLDRNRFDGLRVICRACAVENSKEWALKKAGVEGDHGKLYNIWSTMKQRCNNPKDKAYKRYGGRGIKICDRWNTFANFLADVGDPPSGLSLDRIDNNGNYEPGNCKWSTRKEQQNNMRTNTFLTYKGERKTIAQWSDELKLNLSYDRMVQRLSQGWSLRKIAIVYSNLGNE